jgi:hypothetical protein
MLYSHTARQYLDGIRLQKLKYFWPEDDVQAGKQLNRVPDEASFGSGLCGDRSSLYI